MNRARFWVAAGIIAVVIIIGFVISVPHTRDATLSLPFTASSTLPLVTLDDTFRRGMHTVTGSLMMPNACGTLAAEAYANGENDDGEATAIHIALTLETGEGVCLELPTKATFSVTAEAKEDASITVTVNGEVASSTRS